MRAHTHTCTHTSSSSSQRRKTRSQGLSRDAAIQSTRFAASRSAFESDPTPTVTIFDQGDPEPISLSEGTDVQYPEDLSAEDDPANEVVALEE